eukprot:SAG31_NODE_41112_length_277_cov_1.297753_1_plen_38_part_01
MPGSFILSSSDWLRHFNILQLAAPLPTITAAVAEIAGR